MGYLLNSGSGFLKDAVNVASDVKTYLINKGGYLYDTIRIGINDFGQRVLDDGGTIEGSSSAAASYKEITKTVFDSASLVLFPSGYKESKVYSHKPVDGSADFTYTRGTDTATRVNEQGLIEKESGGLTDSMPRIDHTGGEPCLLFEPQRTNQIVDSEDFSTANWDRQSCTVTSSATTSPDGTTNASKIVADNGTTNFRLRPTASTGVAGNNVHSVFVKHLTGGFDYIVLGSTNSQHRYAFNIKTGAKVGDVGANELLDEDVTIEDYGSGWYRCSIMVDSAGPSKFEIYLSDDGTGITATGNGTKGAYIWGAQTEQGHNYLTSYIPTSGATATRAFDDFGSLVYDDNFNSLTLYADVEMKNVIRDDIKANIRFGHASNNNGSVRIFRSSASNTKRAVVNVRNLSTANIIDNITATEDRARIKITYDSSTGDWELFINESSEATGTSTDFNEFDTLELCGMGGTMRLYKLYIKNSI